MIKEVYLNPEHLLEDIEQGYKILTEASDALKTLKEGVVRVIEDLSYIGDDKRIGISMDLEPYQSLQFILGWRRKGK